MRAGNTPINSMLIKQHKEMRGGWTAIIQKNNISVRDREELKEANSYLCAKSTM